MNPLIEIKDFSLSYNKADVLLNASSLSLLSSEIVVLFGENGSGKSSLLRAISNSSKDWKGTIEISGKDLKHWKHDDFVKQMAFISTEQDYPSLLSTKDYISFGRYPHLNWFGKMQKKDEEIILKYLKECCIEELSNQSISFLSDGERQRAKIARGLCQQTPLLILDEPTSHLDIKNSYAILELIKLEREKENKSFLFSSHEINMSLKVADKVWFIIDGIIYQESTAVFQKNHDAQKTLFGSSFQLNL